MAEVIFHQSLEDPFHYVRSRSLTDPEEGELMVAAQMDQIMEAQIVCLACSIAAGEVDGTSCTTIRMLGTATLESNGFNNEASCGVVFEAEEVVVEERVKG